MTTLTQLVEGQAEAATQVNENFDAVSQAGCYGRKAETTNLLTWGYYGGNAYVNNTVTAIADGTVTLTAASTNYVEASPSTGAVSVNTSGFTSGYVKLYEVTTNGTTVTAYTDKRFNYGVFSSVIALPTFMGCMVKKSGNLTAQNLTTATAITFDAEDYDTNSFHSTSANTSRITIPAGLGIARVKLYGSVRLEGVAPGTNDGAVLDVYKNGTKLARGPASAWSVADNTETVPSFASPPIECTAGDYFELYIKVTTDTSVDIYADQTFFALEVVEATRLDAHRSQFSTIASASGDLAVNVSGYEYFKTTLTENVTSVTLSGVTSGVINRFEIRVAQDGTGGRTWANPASWKFPGGTAYTPSAAASAVDILRGRTYDDGTTWEVEFQKGYA